MLLRIFLNSAAESWNINQILDQGEDTKNYNQEKNESNNELNIEIAEDIFSDWDDNLSITECF